ncbi:MAG: hypothetical protein V3S04_04185, partial [Candidatus Omnitrophota bacterium]
MKRKVSMRKSLYLAVAILFLSCNALFAQAGLLGEEEDAVGTGMSDPGPGIYTEHMSEERMARERQEDEGSDNTLDRLIFHVGKLEPTASTPKLNIGDEAPDFKLPAVSPVLRTTYALSEYKGRVASLYGVFRSDAVSERALFVIDKKGVILFTKVYDINT